MAKKEKKSTQGNFQKASSGNDSEEKSYVLVSKDSEGKTDLSIKNLTLRIPHGGPTLLEDINLTIEKGKKLVVTGASGTGKSTLAKAILDMWDTGEGTVLLPPGAKIMAVSQEPYFSDGTVRELLNSPEAKEENFYPDSKLTKTLKTVGHEKLIQHIPGQQIHLIMNKLLRSKTLNLLNNKTQTLPPSVTERIQKLVQDNFTTVQYTPKKQRDYLKKRLAKKFPSLKEDKISFLADLIVEEIDQSLLNPLHRHLKKQITDIAKQVGKTPIPYSTEKINYFCNILQKKMNHKLTRYRYNKDTDNEERAILINGRQGKKAATYIADTMKQELLTRQKETGFLTKTFNTLSWPYSFFKMRKKSETTAKNLMQKLSVFMETQNVTGDMLARRLSGGEKQRFMFARVLLHEPDILILDEITAALDAKSGAQIYKDMLEKLPNTMIISIAHNEYIRDYHDLHAHLENKKLTTKKVTPPSSGKGSSNKKPPSPKPPKP